MNNIKKIMLISVGLISLILGVIGILMPILPTTPFLLLSSYCFLKSSKKLYEWLIHHKILGKYIYNYIHYRAVKKSAKIFTVAFLWSTMILSMFIVRSTRVSLILCLIGILVSTHILRLKNLSPEMLKSNTL